MSGKLPAFRLPRLTAAVDCSPLGYPGLEVHFWLNVTVDADRIPDEDWAAETGKPIGERPTWERDYYYSFSRIIERIVFPASYVDGDDPVEIPIPDGKALFDLMGAGGFDQAIVNWAATHYYALKQERLEAERKN